MSAPPSDEIDELDVVAGTAEQTHGAQPFEVAGAPPLMRAAIGAGGRCALRQPAFREPDRERHRLSGLRRKQFEWTHRSRHFPARHHPGI